MISPSIKLEKKYRDLLDEQFKSAQREIGEEEFHYIGQSLEKKVASVKKSGTSWIRDLAETCDAIHQIYLDHIEGTVELADADLRAIGAALFYFVNPYDLIPDHIPVRGYLDDVYVVNVCVDYLDKRNSGMVSEYLKKQ